MVNEALAKVLCHNIVVLVQATYELGIVPVFWEDEPEPTDVEPIDDPEPTLDIDELVAMFAWM